jgi:hypothetical protein
MSEHMIVNILIGIAWGILCLVAYKRGKTVGRQDAEEEGLDNLRRCSAGWISEMNRIFAILRAAGIDLVALGIERAPVMDVSSYSISMYDCCTPGSIVPVQTLVEGEDIPKEEGGS